MGDRVVLRTTICNKTHTLADATVRSATYHERVNFPTGFKWEPGWLVLDEVWVSTRHRRQGYGRQVVRQAMQLAAMLAWGVLCRPQAHGRARMPQVALTMWYRDMGFHNTGARLPEGWLLWRD